MLKSHQLKLLPTHHKQFRPAAAAWLLSALLVGFLGGALLVALHTRAGYVDGGDARLTTLPGIQLSAIIHYATSREVPQQTPPEIAVSIGVLRSLGGAGNFLVFGLGHDSLMWAAANARGTTLFLEEDPKWVQTVLKDAPDLRADTVGYRTRLSHADRLLRHAQTEPDCAPERSFLRGNDKCRLALNMLPDEVYDTEWDMIMVDAPRGYFPEAPGRMAAIYSAAVMARHRRGPGDTHVFVHDVDRRVEKAYAEAFLCRKNLVKAVGRLWHFQIPPAAPGVGNGFC